MPSSVVTRNLIILSAALAGVAGFGYLATLPIVPRPDEANRVHHPAGFSIVLPEDWEQHFTFAVNGRGADSLEGLPRKVEGSPGEYITQRLPDSTTESQLAGNHFVRETLDGKPIWVSRIESARRHNHTIIYVFQAGEQWYQILITRQITEPLEGAPWTDYVRTFRVDPAPPSRGTLLHPATKPNR